MTRLYMRKHLGALRPLGSHAEEALRRIKHGAEIEVTIRQPRNIRHHRKWWALINLVFENQSHYEQIDHMVLALKVALGHCDTVIDGQGKVLYHPRSMAFHNMDQTEFEAFYEKTVDLITTRFLPGVTDEQLREQVLELVA